MHRPACDRGLRILAPDRPGIGASTFQPGRKLLDWPPLLAQLADLLGISNFSILGISGGGPYVLACAHAISGRIAAAGIICGAPPVYQFSDRRDLHPTYRLLRAVRRFAPWVMPPFFSIAGKASGLPQGHPLVRGFLRTLPAVDRAALAAPGAYDSVARSFQDAIANGTRPLIVDGDIYYDDWRIDLAAITFPVRFWHGECDRNIPVRMAREVTGRLPNARAKWYPGEGHFSLPIRHFDEILDDFTEDIACAAQRH